MDARGKPVAPSRTGGNRTWRSAERWRAWRAESIGVVVIALAILLYTVLRYGAHINWSAR